MDFPLPAPTKLPIQISPCPIVGASMEIRFTTNEPSGNLQGILASKIREKYPNQTVLPLNNIPELFRQQQPNLTYQPLVQFEGLHFFIQLGPRVLALAIKPASYPGWTCFLEEMQWLLQRVKEAAFIDECERLSVRYIDFFESNIFHHLTLEMKAGDHFLPSDQCSLATVFQKTPFTIRLNVANGALVQINRQPKRGGILDIDVWAKLEQFDLFENGLDQFEKAHQTAKDVFFGLLKPSFLSTLNPQY